MKKEDQNSAKAKNLNKRVENYQQVYGPSTSDLQRGMWWINNRTLIRRISYGLIIFFSILVWSYTIYNFGSYLYKGMDEDERLLSQLVKNRVNPYITASIKAQELEIGKINITNSIEGKSDIFASIKNPNTDWHVSFNYYFKVGQEQTKEQRFFINPNETKYLTEFLYPGAELSATRLMIKDLKWQRIDYHQIKNIDEYLNDHLNIVVSDIKTEKVSDVNASSKEMSAIYFTAINDTAYNYWDVDFYLLLKSGQRIVGINKYQLNEFKSGQKRDLIMLWPRNVSDYKLEIMPAVDVFNEDNYFKFNLGEGQLK